MVSPNYVTFGLTRVFTSNDLHKVNISEGSEVLFQIPLCGVGSEGSDIKFPEALRSFVNPDQVTPRNDVVWLMLERHSEFCNNQPVQRFISTVAECLCRLLQFLDLWLTQLCGLLMVWSEWT